MTTELLDPRNDFVFKRIFGSEDNKDVLLAFLNRAFAESGEPPLTEIVLLNPYTDKDAPLDKQSIFDIWAKTIEGKLINVEMQLFNKYDIEKRTLYYWSRRYSSQLQEGQSYKQLKKCVTINILNFTAIANDRYHNVYHLREDHTGLELCEDIEVHVMELSKLDDQSISMEGGLVNWLLFLKSADKSNWEVLRMNEPNLKKAMDTLEFLSLDREARRKYEERQKYLHDEASMIEWATDRGMAKGMEKGVEKGIAQGIVQGEQKKAMEIAKNMLAMGIEVSVIVKASGLTKDEVESLKSAQ
ncbi:Rpn family recombination-promoting nuclease/putative transposase [Paenibacillus macerans]|nr:Rpn family recombination-promoting nuclease/putative transposase [Paenibacillus macerans]MCM3703987.1 Rpn family recombination-promoting nuclease/putative transposase [Paenibacillus macerans]